MIEIEIKRSGLDLEFFGKGFREQIANKLVKVSADKIVQYAKEEAPVRTGRMRDSITATVSGLEARVSPNVPYFGFVEFGTQPHMIEPVYARVLRFEVMGQVVFSAYAWHTGTKANPFMERAKDRLKANIDEVFKEVWKL